jgi:hypothetical protein
MAESADVLEISMTEEVLPARDPSHGTPDPMVRRLVMVRSRGATARFEQTDYGHPGRFNAWAPRGIDARLQPRTDELLRLCEALGALAAK